MSAVTWAQRKSSNEKYLSVDIGYIHTQLLNKNFNGGNFDFKFYVLPNFSTGLSTNILGTNTTDTFGFSVKRPQLNFISIGWINQFDFYNKNRFRFSASLNNALGITTLTDKETYSMVWVNNHYQKQYKQVASNYHYLFEPGIEAGFLLSNSQSDTKVYLTTKARYRSASNKINFGDPNSISHWYFGIGINFIGLAEEQSSSQHYRTNRMQTTPNREWNNSPIPAPRSIPTPKPSKNW